MKRRELLAQHVGTPASLRAALADCAFSGMREVAAEHLPEGWAIVALAGTAKLQLCPWSDLDLALLHPSKVSAEQVSQVAQALWYPLWDDGWTVTPLVHTSKSALSLADSDLVAATAFLNVGHVAGSGALTEELRVGALSRWQKAGAKRIAAIAEVVAARHQRYGEVAFMLEPDLKEGQGSLRDLHAMDWAIATGRPEVVARMEIQREALTVHEELLLDVRTVLHTVCKRANDQLHLQDQAAVAEVFGISDDELMRRVSVAGREIQWTSERFWEQMNAPRAVQTTVRYGDGVELVNGRMTLAASFAGSGMLAIRSHDEHSIAGPADAGGRGAVDLVDLAPVNLEATGLALRDQDKEAAIPSALVNATDMLRVAAAAAQANVTIATSTLERFAAEVEPISTPWPAAARVAFVRLLGAGRSALRVIEALDRFRLFERVLPEWEAVRCKPQRNAYHRFTVDRHLCETAMNAAVLVRAVHRPDLLLVGALLHDIGKGFLGDHTVVGMELVANIGARMGFDADDTAVLVAMVAHHLLLPEVATRRDLSEPATIESVATAVQSIEVLELLGALTEADSLATGITAWSDWKKKLLTQLVDLVRAHLSGVTLPPSLEEFPSAWHLELLETARVDGQTRVVPREGFCTVVAPDRTGLLACVAGALSLHGVEVLSANGWSSHDGLAVEEYRIERRLGGEPPWSKIERDLAKALNGDLDIGKKLTERALAYAGTKRRTSAAPAAPPAVLIDTQASATSTLIEVRAPDRVGILYDVADVLAQAGLDIRVALVETLGNEVVDVFYVCQNAGPITDPTMLATLEAVLLNRIA
jgi:[protein-PII] uridylyltransferase